MKRAMFERLFFKSLDLLYVLSVILIIGWALYYVLIYTAIILWVFGMR